MSIIFSPLSLEELISTEHHCEEQLCFKHQMPQLQLHCICLGVLFYLGKLKVVPNLFHFEFSGLNTLEGTKIFLVVGNQLLIITESYSVPSPI